MNIGFFGVKEQEKKDFYTKSLPGHSIDFIDEIFNNGNPPKRKDFDIISIFVECTLSKNIIALFPNLKFVAVRSTGTDNVDINYARQKNILVSNVPGYGSKTVAEFTFGLLISLLRKIPQSVKRIKEEGLFNFENLKGTDLYNKTLGVVGTGKIGMNVIKIAKGFGMKVLANDKFPNYSESQKLGFEYADLEFLFKQSNILTLHVPATDETYHLINSNNIFSLQKGSFLINTSRGSVIETKALYDGLIKGHLAGVALDVIEDEMDFRVRGKSMLENPLTKLENVLITPHMAFYTKEAEETIMKETVLNILSFTEGSPKNLVEK